MPIMARQRPGSIPDDSNFCNWFIKFLGDFHRFWLDFSPMEKYHEYMPVDSEEMRHAMRQWTTGVSIVSAANAQDRHGMTVSSLTSLSLEPPLVAVSLERWRKAHQLVEQTGHFGVTILRREHQEISDRFAGRSTEQSDRFAGLEIYTLVSGAPLLKGGLAAFDCSVVYRYEAGTQTVFIGEVLAVRIESPGAPLVYHDRLYRSLQE
jgi:flavin reductase (DIM6/NTAB) family NADH-FMN oxidoreductase RutF